MYIYQWHTYLQVFHQADGMKYQHETLIQSAESELDRPVGFYGEHLDDVTVPSSVHVMNSNWTEQIYFNVFDLSITTLIKITWVLVIFVIFHASPQSMNISTLLVTNINH